MTASRVEFITETALAGDLAVTLALEDFDVELSTGSAPSIALARGSAGAPGVFALDVNDVQSLVVALSTSGAALATLAKTVVDLLRRRDQDGGGGQFVVTGGHNTIISCADAGAVERVVTLLADASGGPILVVRQPGAAAP